MNIFPLVSAERWRLPEIATRDAGTLLDAMSFAQIEKAIGDLLPNEIFFVVS